MATQPAEFEYDQLMRSYHEYLSAAAKGISIYLLIIGACLTLPNTVSFEQPNERAVFREMCHAFALLVSIGGIVTYLVASYGFFRIHRRAVELAGKLKLAQPSTWILPFMIWASCTIAALLVLLISKYA